MRFFLNTVLILAIAVTASSWADQAETGPVVENFGPVYAVPEGSYNLDPGQQYKVVMDVGSGQEGPGEFNRRIDTAARFLNMHSRNGIKNENLKLAVVLHGSGARAGLLDTAHEAKFNVANPSADLIRALAAAGVEIYMCGQTAGYYGYKAEDLQPGVTMAVSAMTAHVKLQQEGYQAILF